MSFGASRRPARRFAVVLLLVMVASGRPETVSADMLAFTGESLGQNALHPLLDFGEGRTESLSTHAAALATVAAVDTDILLLTIPGGEIRFADALETGVVLRSDRGLSLPLREWIDSPGHVVLLEGTIESISPASIEGALLATGNGTSASLVPDGTVIPVPEASMAPSLIAGCLLLQAVQSRRRFQRTP